MRTLSIRIAQPVSKCGTLTCTSHGRTPSPSKELDQNLSRKLSSFIGTDHPARHDGSGVSTLVVAIHFEEYQKAYTVERKLIPNEVVGATVNGATPVRAWREYLKLTQAEVAARLGITFEQLDF